MKYLLLLAIIFAVSLHLFFGCRSVQKEARIPGIIEYHDQKSILLAPTMVQAGKNFKVKINTFGGGCERAGDEDVIFSESSATVKVYDYTTATKPDVMCPAVLLRFPHTITLRFAKPGEATIRIEGTRQGNDTPPKGVPSVLEHRLMITATAVSLDFDPDLTVDQWTVNEKGVGPIRIGMHVDEANLAWGGGFTFAIASKPGAACWLAKPLNGPSGISLIWNNRQIARVDVDGKSVSTAAGAQIGDSEKRIKKLYPQVKITARKDTMGHDMTVNPLGEHQIIFETDGKQVIRYRAGRMPEVSWAKKCP